MQDNKEYYSSRFVFDKGRTVVWKAINEYLSRFIPQNASVLDLGCGYGDFINFVHAKEKWAIDLNEDLQHYLSSEVRFKAQSVLNVFEHIQPSSLDLVFASNLFEHFDDIELLSVISNIKHVLKPGGKIMLMQPNIYYASREYWDDYTHKKAFSHVSLADFLVANGFDIVKVEKKFIPFSLKSRLPKSYLLTKLYLMLPFRIFAKQMLIVAELR